MLSDIEEYQAGYINIEDAKTIQAYIDGPEFVSPTIARNLYSAIKDSLTASDITEAMFCSSLSCNIRAGYIVGVKGVKRVGYKKIDRVEPLIKPEPQARRKRGKASVVKPTIAVSMATSAVISDKQKIESILRTDPSKLNLPEFQSLVENLAKKKPVNTGANDIDRVASVSSSKRGRHVWIGQTCYLVFAYQRDIEKFLSSVLNGVRSGVGAVTFDGHKWEISDVEIFKKYITEFHSSKCLGEMNPLVTTDNELPVEYQMASN
jgi:hypothetical protein